MPSKLPTVLLVCWYTGSTGYCQVAKEPIVSIGAVLGLMSILMIGPVDYLLLPPPPVIDLAWHAAIVRPAATRQG